MSRNKSKIKKGRDRNQMDNKDKDKKESPPIPAVNEPVPMDKSEKLTLPADKTEAKTTETIQPPLTSAPAPSTPAVTIAVAADQMATDSRGNLYLIGGHQILKINNQGVASLFAGKPDPGYSGDGQLAINAQLADPSALACDGAGNIFIFDAGNDCIRKVDSHGRIVTFVDLSIVLNNL